MAKTTRPLSAKRIEQAIKSPGRYHDGHGLYLQVTERGASWVLRSYRGGKERMLGLGALHIVDLKSARERARLARLKLLDGIDPVAEKKAEKAARALEAAKAMTFEEAAKRYYELHADTWKNRKHRLSFLSTLRRFAFPQIGNLSVASIDTGLVLKVIEPLWRNKTPTADRVRNRIEAVLGWATVRGYRTGDNPARWRGHLAEVLPQPGKIKPSKHHAAMPFIDVPGFMAELREREGIPARALEFTVLTAARTGETLGATWDEIDLEERVWSIGERMKEGTPHRVPLSDPVLTLLRALPREEGNPFVFVGSKQGNATSDALSGSAMLLLIRRMHKARAASGLPPWVDKSTGELAVPHGFRSSFTDWAHERGRYAKHVIDMALAHTISDKVEAAYRRGELFDERRIVMNAWASFCMTPVSPADVVPIRGEGSDRQRQSA